MQCHRARLFIQLEELERELENEMREREKKHLYLDTDSPFALPLTYLRTFLFLFFSPRRCSDTHSEENGPYPWISGGSRSSGIPFRLSTLLYASAPNTQSLSSPYASRTFYTSPLRSLKEKLLESFNNISFSFCYCFLSWILLVPRLQQ